MVPIWKDYFVTLGAAATPFRILVGGVVVYTGKAYLKPGESTVRVRINDIVADHFNGNASVTAITQVYTADEEWENQDTATFSNDWSYDYNYTESQGVSFPVNGHIDSRQSADLATQVSAPGDYAVVTSCAEYAIYYTNAHGGKDTFLIEGNAKQIDTYNRYERNVDYDNGVSSNRGRENYVTEVVTKFYLHTGWLTDAQAERMFHLLGATDARLRDLNNGVTYAIAITNAECEYKTYHNQGNAMLNYIIECEVAQNRVRR